MTRAVRRVASLERRIAGGNGNPVMAGFLSAYSLASGASGVIPPLSDWSVGTSDASIMAPDPGTDQWFIYAGGVYSALVAVDMTLVSGTPAADTSAQVAFNIYGIGLLEGQVEPWNGFGEVAMGGTVAINLDAPPTGAPVSIQQDSGHTANVNIELLIVQHNPVALTLS